MVPGREKVHLYVCVSLGQWEGWHVRGIEKRSVIRREKFRIGTSPATREIFRHVTCSRCMVSPNVYDARTVHATCIYIAITPADLLTSACEL